jgi:hypothetical protein
MPALPALSYLLSSSLTLFQPSRCGPFPGSSSSSSSRPFYAILILSRHLPDLAASQVNLRRHQNGRCELSIPKLLRRLYY